jgi:hypothetical protein
MVWDNFVADESAQWGKALSDTHLEGDQAKDAVLTEAAGRGFMRPPGGSLDDIDSINRKIQGKLLEQNAKIYEIEAKRLLQEYEFGLGIDLAQLKMALELYKADLQNVYEMEEAEAAQLIQMEKSDIDRLLSEIDAGQADLIEMKAALENDISAYHLQIVESETVTLAAQEELAQAKLDTAKEKLKIIDELYQLIAAEQLVIVAEQQRMAALEKVITAQTRVAEIKKTMVPYMKDKAAAKMLLADAITLDTEAQKLIVLLGYDKIALKDTEQAAEEMIRQAEITWENAHNEWVVANLATELARIKARIALLQHSTDIKYEVLGYDLEAAKKRVDLKVGREVLSSDLERYYNREEGITSNAATNRYATSHAAEIMRRAVRHINRMSGTTERLLISKG